MARKQFDSVPEQSPKEKEINEAVIQYFDDKQSEKELKESISIGNELIKNYMASINSKSKMFGDYKVTVSVQDRSTFNEAKLLQFLWSIDNLPEGLIKTKEYVDMDVLENAIYKGLISSEQLAEMQKCKDIKESVSLRVTKPKKKED